MKKSFLILGLILLLLGGIFYKTVYVKNNTIKATSVKKTGKQVKKSVKKKKKVKEEKKVISNAPKEGETYEKEVFLTFDDGPSKKNTPEVLKILKENDVRATFFVIGKKAEENKDLIKQQIDAGMSVQPHTYSHEYSILYRNVDAYFEDLNKVNKIITDITNKPQSTYVRLPGGSDNTIYRNYTSRETLPTIRKQLVDKGIGYVDWNVSSADADPKYATTERIRDNVINQCKERNFAVVLMHDAASKEKTVKALDDMIKGLKKQGFVFRTFNDLNDKEKETMKKLRIMNRGIK